MTIFIAVYLCELSIFCLFNFSHSGGYVVVLGCGLFVCFFKFLLNYTMYTSITCFISLHFVIHCRYCVFYKLKVCVKQVYWGYFFRSIGTVRLLCVSVSHLVILAIFQTFSLLIYLLW